MKEVEAQAPHLQSPPVVQESNAEGEYNTKIVQGVWNL
jgi:hypothetical protein